MQLSQQHSRINLAELKAQIVKKLGPEGSKQYFYYLNRFLSLKLNKVEFNKLCLKILGSNNIPLHNKFIRSILKNASDAKLPPPPPVAANHKKEFVKHGTRVGESTSSADGFIQNGSCHSLSQTSYSPGLSNGVDMLPPVSPQKARSALRGRINGDRRSVLGPDKTYVVSQGTTNVRVSENVDICPLQPSKNSTVRTSEDGLLHVYIKDNVVRDEGKEASTKIPLEAPLGIRRGQRDLHRYGNRYAGTSNHGSLLDNLTLREQMEQIALRHGLEGVSADCASILNIGLDCYLKGLIRSCKELKGTKSENEPTKSGFFKQLLPVKPINGVKPGYHHLLQNSIKPLEAKEQNSQCAISLQEFKVTMELNPRQLGEDWPLLLERICTRAFEE